VRLFATCLAPFMSTLWGVHVSAARSSSGRLLRHFPMAGGGMRLGASRLQAE
jgi:hypothetical protein